MGVLPYRVGQRLGRCANRLSVCRVDNVGDLRTFYQEKNYGPQIGDDGVYT